jgi:hypothetical protein
MTLADVKSKLDPALQPVVDRWTVEESQSQPCAVGALYVGDNKIVTYPMLKQLEPWRATRQLACAVGCALWSSMPDTKKQKWKSKAVNALESDVAQFWAACKTAGSWSAVVQSVKQAVPRLVAIHLSNALIANRVPFTQAAANQEHPCTEGVRTSAALFSLIPLLSAYAPQLIHYVPPDHVCTDGSDFKDFFAELATGGLECIGETSVRQAVKTLILQVSK